MITRISRRNGRASLEARSSRPPRRRWPSRFAWLATASLALLFAAAAPLALSETAKLTPADGQPSDDFGAAVAIEGDTAVIGSDHDDDQGLDSGSVYVYLFDGEFWLEEAKLTADDGAPDDLFGRSVAISGSSIVVGAPLDDDRGDASGSAYVFVLDEGEWVQQAKLTASDGEAFALFGQAVAIAGELIVVGAAGEDTLTGATYVFRRVGTQWAQQARLTASDGTVGDLFGRSVAAAPDLAVAGADDPQNVGAAYVFRYDGESWTEEARLTPSEGAAGDVFARAVAAGADAVVASARGDDEGGDAAGAAYVFLFDGMDWVEDVKLVASDASEGDGFGAAVSIDGGTTVVGSSESAYVFVNDGGEWFEEAKLAASDGVVGDLFGSAVGITGETTLVGAPKHRIQIGAAYTFFVPEPSRWLIEGGALAVLTWLARRGRLLRHRHRHRHRGLCAV